MADIDEVLRRISGDDAFRNSLVSDPASALKSYNLGAEDLTRIDRALQRQAEPTLASLLGPSATRLGASPLKMALVAATLAVAGAGIGYVAAGSSGTTPSAFASDAVDMIDCPARGGGSIGQLHRGDRVWVIGRAGGYLAIQHPSQPGRAAWVIAVDVVPDEAVAGLPVVDCEVADATAIDAALPTETPPSSTVDAVTTTVLAPVDVTGPTINLQPERTYIYTGSGVFPCSDEDELEVTVQLSDPSAPTTVVSLVATYVGTNGETLDVLVVPSGSLRWTIGTIDAFAPQSGTSTMTVTVTARDSLGNQTASQFNIEIRASAPVCIG
ncbi:MAG: hypothetical protein ABL953_01280 [Ilumatobacteraceae bacterium]